MRTHKRERKEIGRGGDLGGQVEEQCDFAVLTGGVYVSNVLKMYHPVLGSEEWRCSY